ncbi:MAG TPA: hypothetical protein PLA39_10040 [Methanoculleus sp.]|nr:hypothetical protein [Methanoculleus sp.]
MAAGSQGYRGHKPYIGRANISSPEMVDVPYRWNSRRDVDEAVVVVMNTMDSEHEIGGWLMETLQGAINDSDPELVKHFFSELEQHRPEALRYFAKPEF